MEASSSSAGEGGEVHKFLPELEAHYALEDGFTYSGDDETDEPNEHGLEGFEKETSSDGEGLPQEVLQLGKPSSGKQVEVVVQATAEKKFEKFDVVQDYSDHMYANYKASTKENKVTKLLNKLHIINSSKHQERTGPTKDWARRIQQEWKSLEKDLPEGIYVRVYEERMELLRAAIVGPAGTPYHDGLFFFDVHFPFRYPAVPPLVWYHAHGLGLNPNLYSTGYVCLSLLGTWYGKGCEKWNPNKSTLLQVLVSIQAIVFNSQPYFNEPVLPSLRRTASYARKKSLDYNKSVFLLSCNTMLHTLRKPPKNFEGLVASHFRGRGRAILLACKAYMKGTTVGSEVVAGGQGTNCNSAEDFISNLNGYFKKLLAAFQAKGADCEGLVS